MSAKYGISMQTLKLIQKKKAATDVSANITQQLADSSSPTATIPMLCSLFCALHHQFQMASKTALPVS
jgi:hypothetical protein